MNARLRSTLRPLLVALVLCVGSTQAAGLDEALEPVRDGLKSLAPVMQTAAGLPFLGNLVQQVVARRQEARTDLDALFDDVLGGPSFEGVNASGTPGSDPFVDEFGADDLALLEL